MNVQFPTTQTLDEFIKEQVGAFKIRIAQAEQGDRPKFVYRIHHTNEFNDSVTLDIFSFEAENEDESHLYESQYQFTGSASASGHSTKKRAQTMLQMVEYIDSLKHVLNSLDGWTPFK